MAGATPAYIDIRATIMEHDRTTTAFSRLQQSASPSVATNYNGGAALMDIGAINKGKGKGKYKGKGKKGKGKGKKDNKGQGYGQKGYGRKTQGKGKGPVGQTVQYKGYSNYTQGKGKGQGKATVKGKGHTTGCYRCGQPGHPAKTVELQSITFRRTSRKDTTMQLSSSMDHKPPMTTIGGQTAKHKSMQRNNHNNLHCQHLHN